MLRVALQNAILIALIIVILSYLISNATVEKFPGNAPLALKNPPSDPVDPAEEVQQSVPASMGKNAREIELFQWAHTNDIQSPTEYIQPPMPYVSNQPPKIPKECNSHLDIDDYLRNKQSKGSPPKKQTQHNLVLSEYPNENIMNGGQIFTGITGFDGSETQFSEI